MNDYNNLKATKMYERAFVLINEKRYVEAKKYIQNVLSLDFFNTYSFMRTLYEILKVEVEFELGEFDNCKNTILKLKEVFETDSALWDSEVGIDAKKCVYRYWYHLTKLEFNQLLQKENSGIQIANYSN